MNEAIGPAIFPIRNKRNKQQKSFQGRMEQTTD
jgi:hypothetical protein